VAAGVTSTNVVGQSVIYVDAPSSVFVDGSSLRSAPRSTGSAPARALDLFVSGDVSIGQLPGDPADPPRSALRRRQRQRDGRCGREAGSTGRSTHRVRSPSATRGSSARSSRASGVSALDIDFTRASAQPPTCCQPPGGKRQPAPAPGQRPSVPLIRSEAAAEERAVGS
jgi:hypothetical protein